MAKHKTVRGAARGKAPGVQKPKNDPTPETPPTKEPTELDKARAEHAAKLERYQHERFAEEYLDNGGNALQAYLKVYQCSYDSAHSNAHRLMANEGIRALIDQTRAEQKAALGMTREKLLRIQVAMATATLDDFSDVGRKPWDKASYTGLGDKRYALEGVDEGQHGNKVRLVSRQAAVNELWTKLGIKADTNTGRGESTARSLLKKFGFTGEEPGGTG